MITIGKQSSKKLEENFSRGYKYLLNGRFDKAEQYLKRCGNYKEALLDLATCYLHKMQFDKVREALLLAIDPKTPHLNGSYSSIYVKGLTNIGLLEYYLENDSDALAYYREGLETAEFNLIWNYCTVRLRQYCSNKYDDLKFCWQLYETRFKGNTAVILGGSPNWTGGYVESITVLAEQGVGDCIMFARYLPELKKYCDRLVIQCEESVNDIYAGYETRNETGYDTTHAVPFGSLGNLLDYIPDGEWIGGGGSGSMIGCVWQSNRPHANNRLRCCDVEHMLKLGDVGSLGPDCIDPRMPRLPSSTWGETMQTLRGLKCVVTIDSAIAHLCGAMGVKCYVLMPLYNSDFRWGDSSMGHNNKWYKSVTVIRNPGSWDLAFKELNKCLKSADLI